MVIAFEEKYRLVIESNGMTIIEFKSRLYKLSETKSNAYEIIKDAIYKIEKEFEILKTRLIEAFDNVKFMVEQTMEVWHYPTSRRYRVVKILNKCTGIEKLKLWKMTRHTWLAKSCF